MRRCARPFGLQATVSRSRRAQSSSSAAQTKPPATEKGDDNEADLESYEAFIPDSATKTVQTPVGSLPLSPLMDQGFFEAREKWTKPKPAKPVHKKTKFQHALERNPFAQALATPVRRCQITEARLPSYFLEGFNLVGHPETGDPWWVPHDLLTSQKASTTTPQEPAVTEDPQDPVSATARSGIDRGTQPSFGTGYVLSWQPLLTGMSNEKALNRKYFQGFRGMMRAHTGSRLTSVLNRAAWRNDMDAVVLDLMRRRLVDGLVELDTLSVKEDRGYVTKCEGWSRVGEVLHPGCLLVFAGGLDAGKTEDDAHEAEKETNLSVSDADAALLGRVGGHMTLDVTGSRFCHKVPVYDLDRLLGEEHVQALRTRAVGMNTGDMFVLGRARSTELQSWLWKLQGFVANIPSREVMEGLTVPKPKNNDQTEQQKKDEWEEFAQTREVDEKVFF